MQCTLRLMVTMAQSEWYECEQPLLAILYPPPPPFRVTKLIFETQKSFFFLLSYNYSKYYLYSKSAKGLDYLRSCLTWFSFSSHDLAFKIGFFLSYLKCRFCISLHASMNSPLQKKQVLSMLEMIFQMIS